MHGRWPTGEVTDDSQTENRRVSSVLAKDRPEERPEAKGKPKRILEPDEVERLSGAADPPYLLLLMMGALAGLRLVPE